jgi:hypothetical protein
MLDKTNVETNLVMVTAKRQEIDQSSSVLMMFEAEVRGFAGKIE